MWANTLQLFTDGHPGTRRLPFTESTQQHLQHHPASEEYHVIRDTFWGAKLGIIIPGPSVPGIAYQVRHSSGRLGNLVSPFCTAASTGLAEDSTMGFWAHFQWEKLPPPPSLFYPSVLTLFSVPYSILPMDLVSTAVLFIISPGSLELAFIPWAYEQRRRARLPR